MKTIKQGRYMHYKGTEANVIGVATHSETKEQFVIYEHIEAETGKNGLWARPLAMFLEEVIVKGKKVPRFTFLKD